MNTENKSHQNRAIVIGGSMSGLLAARVLNDFFKEVIVIERDKLPESAEQRRGVPQGYHAHALLAGGQRVLEDFFPGILDELVHEGAVPADPLNDGNGFLKAQRYSKHPAARPVYLRVGPSSRPRSHTASEHLPESRFTTGDQCENWPHPKIGAASPE